MESVAIKKIVLTYVYFFIEYANIYLHFFCTRTIKIFFSNFKPLASEDIAWNIKKAIFQKNKFLHSYAIQGNKINLHSERKKKLLFFLFLQSYIFVKQREKFKYFFRYFLLTFSKETILSLLFLSREMDFIYMFFKRF